MKYILFLWLFGYNGTGVVSVDVHSVDNFSSLNACKNAAAASVAKVNGGTDPDVVMLWNCEPNG